MGNEVISGMIREVREKVNRHLVDRGTNKLQAIPLK